MVVPATRRLFWTCSRLGRWAEPGAGVALSVAMAQLQFNHNAVGKFQVAVGAGSFLADSKTFSGESFGFAAGVGYAPSTNMLLRGSAGVSSRGDFAVGVGASFVLN